MRSESKHEVDQRDLVSTDERFDHDYDKLRQLSLEPEYAGTQIELKNLLYTLRSLHDRAESDYKSCVSRNQPQEIYEACIGEWCAYDNSNLQMSGGDALGQLNYKWQTEWNHVALHVRSQFDEGFRQETEALDGLTQEPDVARSAHLDIGQLKSELFRAHNLDQDADRVATLNEKDTLIIEANVLITDVNARLYAYKPYLIKLGVNSSSGKD